MSVRDYLKTLHLFEMTKFLSSEENPSKKAWFYYDEEKKVVRHSFEPADKEWDGAGEKPLIVPLGKDGDQAKLNENWAAFVDMAEELERRERGS
jgi:hypothetical protein